MQSIDPWMVILASGAIGIVIGIALAQLGISSKVKAATEKERKRFEQEKAEVSQQINTQLTDMRDGLIQTVKAYDQAVRLVDEKLGSPSNVIESSNQLHLELKEDEPFKEEPFPATREEETSTEKLEEDEQIQEYFASEEPTSQEAPIEEPEETVKEEKPFQPYSGKQTANA